MSYPPKRVLSPKIQYLGRNGVLIACHVLPCKHHVPLIGRSPKQHDQFHARCWLQGQSSIAFCEISGHLQLQTVGYPSYQDRPIFWVEINGDDGGKPLGFALLELRFGRRVRGIMKRRPKVFEYHTRIWTPRVNRDRAAWRKTGQEVLSMLNSFASHDMNLLFLALQMERGASLI